MIIYTKMESDQKKSFVSCVLFAAFLPYMHYYFSPKMFRSFFLSCTVITVIKIINIHTKSMLLVAGFDCWLAQFFYSIWTCFEYLIFICVTRDSDSLKTERIFTYMPFSLPFSILNASFDNFFFSYILSFVPILEFIFCVWLKPFAMFNVCLMQPINKH